MRTIIVIIEDKKVEAVEIAKREANNVIDFFENNNLVNNSEKAAILYNSGGKGDSITVKGIGGESISSTESEKLLGLHINSSFEWSTHIEKMVIKLKQRVSVLKRIKKRIPKDKLNIIAESMFNSKIRYGIAVYPHTKELQIQQGLERHGLKEH